MPNNDNPKEEKNIMHPEKMDEQKVDYDIRKGAGTENQETGIENQESSNKLNKQDVPESTNDSTGNTGSGQRQDSN